MTTTQFVITEANSTPSIWAMIQELQLADPVACLCCGQLHELATSTKITRRRKVDGYACATCTPAALKLAAR